MIDNGFNIRLFEETDREATIALWEDCGLTRAWNDPNKDIDRKVAYQRDLFFVGERADKLVATAMAGYDGHRGSVFYLAVDPRHQRQCFGRLMMDKVEQSLMALGCPKLNILIRSSNQSVLGFYQFLGYNQDEVVSVGKRLIPDV